MGLFRRSPNFRVFFCGIAWWPFLLGLCWLSVSYVSISRGSASAKNLILTGATGASEAYGSTGSKI